MGKMKLITVISDLSLSSMSSRSSRARVPMRLTRMKIAAKLKNLVEWLLSQAPVPWHIAVTCTSTNYPLITTTAELSSCSQRKKGWYSAVNGVKTHSQSLCAQHTFRRYGLSQCPPRPWLCLFTWVACLLGLLVLNQCLMSLTHYKLVAPKRGG